MKPETFPRHTRSPISPVILFLRDDGHDLDANSASQYTIRAVTQPVGVLADYPVLDVLYYVSARDKSQTFADGSQAKWKSILVETGRDRYREIFHLQAYYTTVSLAPSRIVQSGNERVLVTMDSDGGNGGGCWEGYWWFDSGGPHALDFSRVEAAMKSRVPADTRFATICSHLDVGAEQIQSAVQKSDSSCRSCDFVGEVTARFRLSGAIAEPVEVRFKPGDPQQ